MFSGSLLPFRWLHVKLQIDSGLCRQLSHVHAHSFVGLRPKTGRLKAKISNVNETTAKSEKILNSMINT